MEPSVGLPQLESWPKTILLFPCTSGSLFLLKEVNQGLGHICRPYSNSEIKRTMFLMEESNFPTDLRQR